MSASDPPVVPADDRGLLLGDGLFETVPLYRGRPFRLEAHLARLEGGASRVGIPVPADLRERVRGAVARWKGRDGGLRITLTRGTGPGLAPPPPPSSRLVIGMLAAKAGEKESGGVRGLRAVIRGRLEERALVSGLKVLGMLERVQALRLARAGGADEALIRNSRDLLVEGSASNLLAVRGTVLIAPGPEQGALPGITREVLLGLAPSMGLAVAERGVAVAELEDLSEILLSSSLREVVPVIEVEGRPLGSGAPGPVFLEMARRFREIVEVELGLEGTG
jgi:branched-chain amino acid aminotransferase